MIEYINHISYVISLHSFEIAIIYVIKTRIYILKYVIIQAHFIDIFRHLWYNIYKLLISEGDGIISKIGYIRVSTAEQETARQEELRSLKPKSTNTINKLSGGFSMKRLLTAIISLAVMTACFAGCNSDNSADNSSVSNSKSQTESTNVQEKEESTQTENSTTTNTEVVILDIEYSPASDFSCEYDSTLEGVKIYYKGSDAIVKIPEEIDGKKVVKFGSGAFRECTFLTNVIIPDGVKEISQKAFIDCTSLTSVTISDGLEKIGANSFNGCTALTTVNIPDSVKKINMGAFYDCESLTSVTIPDSVTEIGAGAFGSCKLLTNIIYKGVTYESYDEFNKAING